MKKHLNILLVSGNDFFSDYGGGEQYLRNLTDEFIRREEQITLFSEVRPDKPDEPVSGYRGVEVHHILSRKMDRNLLKEHILALAPDVVHAHGYKTETAVICHELKIPCVVTVHHGGIVCPQGALLNSKDEICHKRASIRDCLSCVLRKVPGGQMWLPLLRVIPEKQRNRWGELIQKKRFVPFVTPILASTHQIERKLQEWSLLRDRATHFIAPSEAMLRSLLINGVRANKLKLIPHGIPVVATNLAINSVSDNGNRLKFFYFGRLSYEKGIHILLKAFDFYCRQHPDSRSELHIIGGAESRAEIRYWETQYRRYIGRKTTHESEKQRIIYHGKLPQPEAFRLIQKLDVMVHPAICLEVYGLNIAEALMLNKPVLATRCGGAEAQIEEGINGYLYNPLQWEELAELIAFFENNPALIRRLSEKASRKVVNIRHHAEEILEEYQSVLKNYS